MGNFKYRLFLDDERWPTDLYSPLVICRTGQAFMDTVEALGYPEVIYFDNDLGGEIEGKHCAQWLLDRIIDRHEKGEPIPSIKFHVHSQNSVSAKEIAKIMGDIERYRQAVDRVEFTAAKELLCGSSKMASTSFVDAWPKDSF